MKYIPVLVTGRVNANFNKAVLVGGFSYVVSGRGVNIIAVEK